MNKRESGFDPKGPLLEEAPLGLGPVRARGFGAIVGPMKYKINTSSILKRANRAPNIMMNYIIVGVNHQSAPVEFREKLAFSKDKLPEALQRLVAVDQIQEGLILSTCNRVEVYAISRGIDCGIQNIKNFIFDYHDLKPPPLAPYLYAHSDKEAIRHLFRVTSSLDSMVVGEPQIVNQVKTAYQQAISSKTSGFLLNRFLERALFVSKKVRTETPISQKTVSVGSAAIQMARQIFSDLSSKNVVLIGAGKIGGLIVSILEEEGASNVVLINRNIDKAMDILPTGSLLNNFFAAYPMEKLEEVLKDADLVISSISAPNLVISTKQISRLMSLRKNRPLFFIDLGVPRNIEAEVNTLENVYLYNIDDLHKVVQNHKGERAESAQMAEAIIDREVARFYNSVVGDNSVITLLGKKFDSIRRRELLRTLAQMEPLTERQRESIEKLTDSIIRKILYDPVMTLKSGSLTQKNLGSLEWLKKLFRLEEEEQ